jgi:site-specific DNA-methyltransferase (adenine-specific)
MIEYQEISIERLLPFPIRELREDVLKNLEERINKRGYNNARPVTVVKSSDNFNVIDGNHRLSIAKKLNLSSLPCVIYPDGENIYKLAIEGNLDEDTYAPMDLFDWLDIIKKLKDEDLTQEVIGEKIGKSVDMVQFHNKLLNNIPTEVLSLCKKAQEGRVGGETTFVGIEINNETIKIRPFNFTEGWFRTSGLYNISGEFQKIVITAFIKDKCGWLGDKLKSETARYKLYSDFIKICNDELVNLNTLQMMIGLILNNTFKTEEALLKKIAELNKQAENKLICGDCLIELEKIEDASIDIVITDPPYGIDYVSNRSEFSEHVTRDGVNNDKLQEALSLLDNTCQILSRKTKADAHINIFTSWKVYSKFEAIIEKYFTIKNMIVWDKGNHGAGDLKYSRGERHELIILCTKGNRELAKRYDDMVSIPKIHSSKMIHPTQKPVEVIKNLLEVSARKTDTICDPFMGSGSTIKAVKEMKELDLRYIGIELDKGIFEKARSFINE